MDWDDVVGALARWHESRDRASARSALVFLEQEFWLMVPPLVRRTLPPDQLEDGLRALLLALLEKPISAERISSPKAYFRKMLSNHFVDLQRARQRRRETPIQVGGQLLHEEVSEEQSPALVASHREELRQVESAMRQLSVADRVALKLEHGPDWLTGDELAWLEERTGLGPSELWQSIAAADDMQALSRIIDPGDDDPADPGQRRHRMERFRKRRARALARLHEVLREAE
jgi:DNA-directed RNA polymerase specialized sigma24 family protein